MFAVRINESTQRFTKISFFIWIYKESSLYLADKKAINQSSENMIYDTHPRNIRISNMSSICKVLLVKIKIIIDLFAR